MATPPPILFEDHYHTTVTISDIVSMRFEPLRHFIVADSFLQSSRLNFPTNSSTNGDNGGHQQWPTQVAKWLMTAISICQAVVGVLLNVGVIVKAAFGMANQSRYGRLRGDVVLTCYVIVLAVVDLLIVLFNVTYIVLSVADEWLPEVLQLGRVACLIRDPFVGATVGISATLMLTIAYERRHRVVSIPRSPAQITGSMINIPGQMVSRNQSVLSIMSSMSSLSTDEVPFSRVICVVVAIVLLQGIIAIPAMIHVRLVPLSFLVPVGVDDEALPWDVEYSEVVMPPICLQSWPSLAVFATYSLVQFGLTFLVPLLATFAVYASLVKQLHSSMVFHSSRRRISKMQRQLALVVVSFALCWAPYKLLSLAIDLHATGYLAVNKEAPESMMALSDKHQLLVLATKLVAMVQTVVNPLLYGVRTVKPLRNEQRRLSSIQTASAKELLELRQSKQIAPAMLPPVFSCGDLVAFERDNSVPAVGTPLVKRPGILMQPSLSLPSSRRQSRVQFSVQKDGGAVDDNEDDDEKEESTVYGILS